MLTFEQFADHCDKHSSDHPFWRPGQFVFNVLLNHRPDLAEQLRGTDLDPFHRSDLIPATLAWLRDNWDA